MQQDKEIESIKLAFSRLTPQQAGRMAEVIRTLPVTPSEIIEYYQTKKAPHNKVVWHEVETYILGGPYWGSGASSCTTPSHSRGNSGAPL